ncbi:MAG TPA: site-2 protease family protein [Thermomicrobiales bacterium]|nr:site-2 protease family protein [Thermomicrobiales bacterium]
MFGSTLPSDVILARVIAFVVAVTIHEFCHAWSAYQLGDPTAARLGRITLNPVAHFDPIGFLGLMMIAIGWPAFGWGRPVPVNPNQLRWGHRGMALTALAGPLSNVVLAILFVVPLRLLNAEPVGFADVLVTQMIFVNLLLAAFNMIPIPPLDGLKILNGVLPPFWYQFMAPMERYGFIALFAVIIIGGQAGSEVIRAMYAPVYDLLHSAIVGPLPL